MRAGLPALGLLILLLVQPGLPLAAADAPEGPEITEIGPEGRVTDTTPVLRAAYSGRVDPVDVVLELDGQRVDARATRDAVRFEPAEPLSPGPHAVTLVVEDEEGRVTDASWSFLVLPLDRPGERVHAHVPLARPDVPVTLGVADAGLSVGGARVTTGAWEANLTLTFSRLDNLPPALPPPPGDVVSMLDVTARSTRDGPPRLAGLRLDVTVPLDEVARRGARAEQVYIVRADGGTWAPEPATSVSANDTHVTVTTTLPGASPLAVIVDTRPPEVSPIAPEDGAFLPHLPEIRAAAKDDVALTRTEVRLDGAGVRSVTDGNPIVSHRVPSLEDGRHVVSVHAEDAAGNAASASWTFILDREPPEFVRMDPVPGSTVASARPVVAVSFMDHASGPDANSARVTLNGKAVSQQVEATRTGLRVMLPEDLAPGAHDVRVTVSDRAGNQAETNFGFTVDASTPAPGVLALLAAAGGAVALARRRA